MKWFYHGKKQLDDLGSLMKYMKTQFYHHKQQLGDSKLWIKFSLMHMTTEFKYES